MSGKETLVKVDGLSKGFARSFKKSLLYGFVDVFRSLLGIPPRKQLRSSEFWALRNVSFELRKGDCLGLIGHNGAGKSTLLKILNGLIAPDDGEVVMIGRVNALIELGAGFNPILSGRENIYINGQILGFRKSQIDDKLDSIIEFSELGDFINAPVQNYSSGMKVRLGFAIAIQMEPTVLIVDEVLAVGDIGFRLKCMNAIDRMLSKATIIFVSHSMPMVSRICNKILLLENGTTAYYGSDVSKGIQMYYEKFRDIEGAEFKLGSEIKLTSIVVSENDSISGDVIGWGNDLSISAELEVLEEVNDLYVYYIIFDKEQRPVALVQGVSVDVQLLNGEVTSKIKVNCIVESIELSKGNYTVNIVVTEGEHGRPLYRKNSAGAFTIESKRDIWQPFELSARWKIN